MDKQYAQMEELMPLLRERLSAGQKVRFSPRGTSMLPMLRQGRDCVILSAVPQKLNRFDLPLYQRADGKYVLHRIVDAGDTYTCMGDNQFTKETGLRKEQMIAVVTGFVRDGKAYAVTDRSYRLYCGFWHYSRPIRHFWRRGIGWLRRHLR